MLNIGNIYNTPVRRIAARVDLYNGSTLVSSYTNTDKIITIDIQRTGETSKFFGFTICHRLNFHILDPNREIVITTANSAKVKIGEAEFPTFFVSEVHRDENTNELSITAYDALKKASALQVDSLTLVKPYTTQQVIDCAAAAIGVAAQTFEDTTFNTSYPNGINIDGTETVREILNAACEATFTIGYLNKNDILVFKRLSNSSSVDLAITKEDYFSLSSGENRRLASIAATTELGNNVSAATAQSGTTQYVKDNPFWDLRNDVDTILNYGISTVGGLIINEFECSWRGNPALEIGDKISITTKDNRTVTAFLLDDTLTYNGGLSQKTQWTYEETDETETNSVNLGDRLRQAYAKVDKQEKRITLLASNVSSQTEAIKKTVKQVDVEYYLSTSNTQLTGGTWATVAPTWENGKYMWSRQKVTYTDGTTATRNATCIAGAKGADGKNGTNGTDGKDGINGTDGKDGINGTDGADGRGISSVTTEYYISTSDTALQGGSWTTTQPKWAEGTYIWTRTKIVYTNPEEVTYTAPLYDAYWVAVNSIAGQQKVNTSNIANLILEKNSIRASVQNITETQTDLSQTVNNMQFDLSDSKTTTAAQIDTLTKRVDAAMTADQVEIAISQELEKGVGKVTTSTGFTFNEDGLTVSRSNVDITTNINEDGMRITKNNEEVLTANNSGVDAKNLHATTYLIIGGNSRFEDYNNGSRTGCFWIGG